MYKKILILGNGFDLDFGLKSRYRDFMNSQIWKRAKEKVDFASYGIVGLSGGEKQAGNLV